MIRITGPLIAAILLLSPPVFGQTADERIDRLEKELRDQKEKYEAKIDELNQRVSELEGTGGDSELDRILKDMEAESEAAFAAGDMAVTGGTTGQTLQNAFNPRLTVFGDFVWRLDNRSVFSSHDHGHEEEEGEHDEEGERIDDRFFLRSTEIDFRADIDPFAKAVAVIAIHEHEPGEYETEAEEIYASFETLPWGLRAKVGKYKASFGVLNRLHPHDLPQTTVPLLFEEWFGEEGVNSTGGELSWLVPQDALGAVELTFGVTNGEEDVLAGGDSRDAGWLGRVQVFEEIGESSWFQVGSSVLFGVTDEDGDDNVYVAGIDITYRWRPPTRAAETSLFVQAEGYLLDRENDHGDTRSLGAFLIVQYQPMRDIYVGTRVDWVEPLDRHETDSDNAWAGGLWLSWYTSEFLRFRLGWEHRGIDGEDDLDTLYFQFTFIFGSHPVEPYWFNK